MRLAVARVHQDTSDLDERERFAARVSAAGPPPGSLALLTCHRAELYALVGDDADARASFEAVLGSLPRSAIVESDREAVVHLFRVAAGLDSAIAGERQIIGQIRAAYERARPSLGGPLAALFERALHVGRSLRASSALGRTRSSLGALAVTAALARLAVPEGARVVVLGAGEMGKLAARALARRVASLTLVNRDVDRAAAIADATDGRALPLAALPSALATADALISAADTRGAILTLDLLAPHAARGLVVVDVAVPRSVAPDARELLGASYISVDELVPVEESLRPEERARCEARCAHEADALLVKLRGGLAAETIARLRERAEAVRQRQLERALSRLGHLSDRDRGIVEALSAGLVNALIHEPTVSLREMPTRAAAARELFRL
jgi:glutamyl-tRNA reductase